MCIICCLLSGCSIILATQSPTEKTPHIMLGCQDEFQVDYNYGPAASYCQINDGFTVKTYRWTSGSSVEWKIARVICHSGMDFLTSFLWELIGTPIELGMITTYEKYEYTIIYKNGKVIKINVGSLSTDEVLEIIKAQEEHAN